MAKANVRAPSVSASRNLFAADLTGVISAEKPLENVIISPASIQAGLTLAYMGAEGETANEMQNALKLGLATRKTDIAQDYGEFFKSIFAVKGSGPQIRMANRIYVSDQLKLNPQFNELATKHFDSAVESIGFSDAGAAIKQINDWVQQQTSNKIKNLLRENSVNDETTCILVNAIYFKGLWKVPFSQNSTFKSEFRFGGNKKANVEMMNADDKYRYGEITSLNAQVLELPYKDSELSMMIILPRRDDGLQELESKLASWDMNVVASHLSVSDVDVYIPKFKIEFEAELKKPLKELGMKSMFGNNADFSSMIESSVGQKISSVVHKAFISVNEAGSEAAAASYSKFVPLSLNLDLKVFRADHPFVFAIRDKYAVYFSGHVAKF